VVTEHEAVVTRDGQRFTTTEYRALGLAAAPQARDDEDSGAESEGTAAA
jgi:hypothetical protein